jgi:hypothetical protein
VGFPQLPLVHPSGNTRLSENPFIQHFTHLRFVLSIVILTDCLTAEFYFRVHNFVVIYTLKTFETKRQALALCRILYRLLVRSDKHNICK